MDPKKEQKKTKRSRFGKAILPIFSARRRVGSAIANTRRRAFKKRLPDYVVFEISGSIAERTVHQPKIYNYLPGRKKPLTMASLSSALQAIAGDPDVKGVLFLLKETSFSLPQAQSLAMLFERFRRWDREYNREPHGEADKESDEGDERTGKEVVVYLEQANIPSYVMSCGADRIVMPPLGYWDVTGLRIEPTYLKDALSRIGIAFDVVKIAPWKTAADSMSRSSMSEEERTQYNWLLGSLYKSIVQAISTGRQLSEADVQSLIDQAPLTAEAAIAANLIDHIAYEDELLALLGDTVDIADVDIQEAEVLEPEVLEPEVLEPATSKAQAEDSDVETEKDDGENRATIKPYPKISSLLFRHAPKRRPYTVGILSLTGAIISGTSRSYPIPMPLVGSSTIGSGSAQQLIRAARENKSLDAVVLHINSPGGSALASDLIWRELKLLDEEKPLVVYMGDVAASGGYYLSIPGRKIVAQATTLTGSIGVIISKPVNQVTYEKLGVNREIVQRGAKAGLYTSASAWDEEEREKITEGVQYVYHAFKERVADSRGIDYDSLDEICHGRVWTGEQALTHNLIDAVGDIQTAIEMACELAEMPAGGTVHTVDIAPPKAMKFALPAQATEALETLESVQEIGKLAVTTLQGEWDAHWGKERHWLFADGLPKIKW